MDDGPYPVGPYEFMAFGTIIQQFARFEKLMDLTINKQIGGTIGITAILLSKHSYAAKRDILNALLTLVIFDGDDNEKIEEFVNSFNKHLALRNNIAHATWAPGTREGSIRAASLSTQHGKLKFRGIEDDDRDYSAVDLQIISDELENIHRRFREFLRERGAMADIEINIPLTSEGSSLAGHPSSS